MKLLPTLYILFFVLVSTFGCSKQLESTKSIESKALVQAKNLIGQNFKSALNSSYLLSSSFSLITEPPGVFRFLSGKTQNGEEIALYVIRDKAIQDFKFKTKILDFHPKIIDGVAIKHKGKWFKYGKGILFYYHTNL